MSQINRYVEGLMHKYAINVPPRQQVLFNNFLSAAEINTSCDKIRINEIADLHPHTVPAHHQQPLQESYALSFGKRKLVIASKKGNTLAAQPNAHEDAFACHYSSATGWGIIALSDGTGITPKGRKGAEIACQATIEYFNSLIAGNQTEAIDHAILACMADPSIERQQRLSNLFIEQLGKVASFAQEKINEEASRKQTNSNDYTTTLIFALTKKFDNGYLICSFWIGDGAIGLYNDQLHEVAVLGAPDDGEFAGRTRFLSMSDILADSSYSNRIRFTIIPDFTALILMTDGITNTKFGPATNVYQPANWLALWDDLNGKNNKDRKVDFSQPAPQVAKMLLQWLDSWSPDTPDDRTIAILY